MHTVNKEVAYTPNSAETVPCIQLIWKWHTANSTHWTMHIVNKEVAYTDNRTKTVKCIPLIRKWHTQPTAQTLGYAYSK